MPMTNTQRHSAALSLAEMQPDKRTLVYFLCQLGLAEHCADGRFASLNARDEGRWFSRDQSLPSDTFTLPVGTVDDRR